MTGNPDSIDLVSKPKKSKKSRAEISRDQYAKRKQKDAEKDAQIIELTKTAEARQVKLLELERKIAEILYDKCGQFCRPFGTGSDGWRFPCCCR